MELKLKKLKIKNFKGIKDLNVNFFPITTIEGENGTGKTSIYDAYLWLLFNKDSQGQTDFEIKPIGTQGVEVEVEAQLEIDGKEYSFKKVLKEKWTKKRGESKRTLTGHTTSYFINDIPKKQREYQEAVKNILPEDLFKIVSNPLFFNEGLKWQERRKKLFELITIKSDQELANDFNQPSLTKAFQKYTPEEYKKVLSSQKRKINDELKTLPARIDELQKLILADMLPSLNDLNTKLTEVRKMRNKANSVHESEDLKKLEGKLLDLLNKKKETEWEIETTQKDIQKKKDNLKDLELEIAQLQTEVKTKKENIEGLKKMWQRVRNQKPPKDISVCFNCGQTLPPAKQKSALADFNKKKAEELEQINSEGKRRKEEIEYLEKRIEKIEIAIIKTKDEIVKLTEEKKKTKEQLVKLQEEEKTLRSQIEKEKVKIEQQKDETEIQKLDSEIANIESQIAQVKQQEQIQKNIEELQKRERQLANQLIDVEKEIVELEKFMVKKVELIEDNINSKFQICEWKLFKTLINGGIEECCECMVDGVPYRNLNTGSKINAGLDIAQTFAKHLQVKVPIWVDNAESITNWEVGISDQVIFLKAVEGKSLIVKEK